MKKIPLELASNLRQKLKKEAKKLGRRPRIFVQQILEKSLDNPENYTAPLKGDWDGDEGPEMIVEIAEGKKRALKKLAKKQNISLKQLCLHILMRHVEISEK